MQNMIKILLLTPINTLSILSIRNLESGNIACSNTGILYEINATPHEFLGNKMDAES